jgi:hypothetical protein
LFISLSILFFLRKSLSILSRELFQFVQTSHAYFVFPTLIYITFFPMNKAYIFS